MDAIPIFIIGLGAIFMCILSILHKKKLLPVKDNKSIWKSDRSRLISELIVLVAISIMSLVLDKYDLLKYFLTVQSFALGLFIAFNVGRLSAKIEFKKNAKTEPNIPEGPGKGAVF